jgi:hypothetical protein
MLPIQDPFEKALEELYFILNLRGSPDHHFHTAIVVRVSI